MNIKKKILFYCKKQTAGSKVCIFDMYKKFKDLNFYTFLNKEDFDSYDFIFIMGNEEKYCKILKNSKAKIIVCDPKQTSINSINLSCRADLLLVSSIEQRDDFLKFNENIIVWPMFPHIKLKEKKHTKKNNITIVYHGNKVHLEALSPDIKNAIEKISKKKRIKLKLIYNIKKLGFQNKSLPNSSGLVVEHIQWNENNFLSHIYSGDIGIVPNLLPIKEKQYLLKKSEVKGLNVNYEPFDYLVRYKCSSNPGRISVFGKLDLPVIAEPTPSNCQIIDDSSSGFLCISEISWHNCILELIENPKLRKSMSKNLKKKIISVEKKALKKLVLNLVTLKKKELLSIDLVNEKINQTKDLLKIHNNKNIFKIVKKILLNEKNL